MAPLRAAQSTLALAVVAAASLTLAGCPAVVSPDTPKEIPIAAQKTVKDGKAVELIVDGTVYGTADLSSESVIKADKPDLAADIGLYHVAAVPGARKLVENAVGVRLRHIPITPAAVKAALAKA